MSQRFLVAVLLLAATAVGSRLADRRIPDSLAFGLDTIQTSLAGWSTTSADTLDAAILRALNPTSYLARTYRRGGDSLDLFIAFYAEQRGGESMHSPKNCLPGSGWEIWDYDSALVPTEGRQIKVNKYFIRHGASRSLLFYWYQSRERVLASEYLAKIMLVRDTVLTGRTAGAIVRIILPERPGADADGVNFAANVIPELQRCFGRGSAGR